MVLVPRWCETRGVKSSARAGASAGHVGLLLLCLGACAGTETSPGGAGGPPAPARPSQPSPLDAAGAGSHAPDGADAISPAPVDGGAEDAVGPPSEPDAAPAGDTAPPAVADAGSTPGDGARADQTPSDPGEAMHLESTGFIQVGADLVFPKSASYPVDQSPPFSFVGVPAAAKSLAVTFVDHSIGAVKWVVWDIPPRSAGLPGNLSKTPHPAELPTSTQRGSLGRTGYSGPGVKGPPLHSYEFQLYALDVATLPDAQGADTVAIRSRLLAAHTLAKSPLFVARGQLGGP
jgi:Raf kinase inhibitor-like YbhB/YbcL family protein